jgi:hypothetical protein
MSNNVMRSGNNVMRSGNNVMRSGNITLIGERLEDCYEKALKERFLEDKKILTRSIAVYENPSYFVAS